MSTLTIIAFGVALAAVVGLCLGLPDSWFCALLALACLLGGVDSVLRDLRAWALAFLASGAMLSGAAVYAAITTGRSGRP
ncbi:hypothetical protein ACF06P_35700 [Streptomyces sp. NPDC015684]|uniref:hypothetical protein n=1 Tax=Streptomyces sp. NPDC015684 TaxID=3364963 RepID=UPI0036FD3455